MMDIFPDHIWGCKRIHRFPVLNAKFLELPSAYQILLDKINFFERFSYTPSLFERYDNETHILSLTIALYLLNLLIDILYLFFIINLSIRCLQVASQYRTSFYLCSFICVSVFGYYLFVLLLDLLQFSFQNFAICIQLLQVLDWLECFNFQNVFGPKARNEDLSDSSFSRFCADVLVDAPDQERVQGYELIHYLLIRLKLAFHHFQTKLV